MLENDWGRRDARKRQVVSTRDPNADLERQIGGSHQVGSGARRLGLFLFDFSYFNAAAFGGKCREEMVCLLVGYRLGSCFMLAV